MTNQNDQLWLSLNTALTNRDQLRPTFCFECNMQCKLNIGWITQCNQCLVSTKKERNKERKKQRHSMKSKRLCLQHWPNYGLLHILRWQISKFGCNYIYLFISGPQYGSIFQYGYNWKICKKKMRYLNVTGSHVKNAKTSA